MFANRILLGLSGIVCLVGLPLQLVTTLVLGILARLTFGLILIPFSLVWMILLGWLLATSWAWEKIPLVRPILALVGIPSAAIAVSYASFLPEMGEWDSRVVKQRLCWVWPFTLDYLRYERGTFDGDYDSYARLMDILEAVNLRYNGSATDPILQTPGQDSGSEDGEPQDVPAERERRV